jgi:ATP-dependent helicase Lhr and Lhr-like helicase
LRLHAQGFVEPVRPSRRAFHILAHQLMALGIQLHGVQRSDWFAWLEGATPFADITPAERSALIDHMLAQEVLSDQDGKLWLGALGEKKYGRMHFSELYAVFSTPRHIKILDLGFQSTGALTVNEYLDRVWLARRKSAGFADS